LGIIVNSIQKEEGEKRRRKIIPEKRACIELGMNKDDSIE
jgi:hypothetical protein